MILNKKNISIIIFVLMLSVNGLIACRSNLPQNDNTQENILEPANGVSDSTTQEIYYCNYMNEEPPLNVPKIFAEGIISTSADEICFEISKSGNEMIIDRAGKIMLSKYKEGKWSELKTASFSGKSVDGECCFSPNGRKIYFASRRPLQGASGELNTWVSEKTGEEWRFPYPIKKPLWDTNTHAVSVSESGNIYMSGVDVFRLEDGEYLPKIQLSKNLEGTHPFISPNEKFIIICARAEGRWDKDLFISYNNDGIWNDPQALNDLINTKSKESNPFVTPDSKYLFFQRANKIYWVEFNTILDIEE